MIRTLLLLMASAPQPPCSHTLAGYPVGDLLVYLNGLLQKSPADYTATGAPPTVAPVDVQVGDSWSAVYSRRVWLAREDWECK